MPDPLVITFSSDAEAALAKAQLVPERLMQALRASLDHENQLTIAHISESRLTGQGPFPVDLHRLGVRTNRLRGSLRATRAQLAGASLVSSIGTNVRYAGAHEFGFAGTVQVRAHKRRIIAHDRYERTRGGNFRLTQMGIRGTVRAHPMRMRIPARAPIRTGIQDRAGNYSAALSQAVIDTLNAGGAS